MRTINVEAVVASRSSDEATHLFIRGATRVRHLHPGGTRRVAIPGNTREPRRFPLAQEFTP